MDAAFMTAPPGQERGGYIDAVVRFGTLRCRPGSLEELHCLISAKLKQSQFEVIYNNGKRVVSWPPVSTTFRVRKTGSGHG